MSDLYVGPVLANHPDVRRASRSDVLEWLGGLTRREKLELLEWEPCDCHGGQIPIKSGEGLSAKQEWVKHKKCQGLGLLPPASQVEAAAREIQSVIGIWDWDDSPKDHIDLMLRIARAALIAAMEGVGE